MRAFGLLARHLGRAARAAPEEVFVLAGSRSYSRAAWLEEASVLAGTIDPSRRPLAMAGSALDLALHAFACSIRKRPFWPVDRNIPAAADSDLPTGIALVISTSGSEGEPRGVMLAESALDAAAAAANRRLPLRGGDLWLACLPLFHIGGQSILWRCARAGAAVLLHEGFVASAVSADLARHPVTHLSLVPAMLARLLEAGRCPGARSRSAATGASASVPRN
jgi:O-succinylbenzoic acid--CoA ligase